MVGVGACVTRAPAPSASHSDSAPRRAPWTPGRGGRAHPKQQKEAIRASERAARLADRIKVIIAERLEKGLRDPRLGFVTLTDVQVTGDLQLEDTIETYEMREKPRG